MSLINKKLIDFKVDAYQNGEFKEVTTKDVLGKWSVFFFYPADFTFVCPTELEDLGTVYDELKKIVKYIQYLQIHISYIKLGQTLQQLLKT